jgi:hypothetical protein
MEIYQGHRDKREGDVEKPLAQALKLSWHHDQCMIYAPTGCFINMPFPRADWEKKEGYTQYPCDAHGLAQTCIPWMDHRDMPALLQPENKNFFFFFFW